MATDRGRLGLGQRLVLLGAWLVSCGFVYVLGVYVGKGMRGGGEITPRVALPVDAAVPAPPPVDAQAPLTFYDVLGSRDGRAPAAPPAEPRAPQPSGLSEQKLSPPVTAPAPGSASPPKAPTEVAKSVPPPVVTRPAAAPAAPSASATGPSAPGAAAVPVAPAKPATPAPPAVTTAVPAVPTATLPPQAASGRWTVYASPTRDQLAVEHERAALRAKGYPAEVVTLRRDGDMWYRIRVGRYATQAQAEDASRRLRSDGVGHAFVQSE